MEGTVLEDANAVFDKKVMALEFVSIATRVGVPIQGVGMEVWMASLQENVADTVFLDAILRPPFRLVPH